MTVARSLFAVLVAVVFLVGVWIALAGAARTPRPVVPGDIPDVVTAREKWLEAVLYAEQLAVAAAVQIETDRQIAVLVAQAQERQKQATTVTRPSGPTGGGVDGVLADIRACESTGDYGAVDSSGTYRGAYQFDYQTWQSVGGSGDPAQASPDEQDYRAGLLYAQRGRAPWPNC